MTTKLYIDLETIPDQRPDAFERYLDAVKPPGNIKKQESIDKWMLENAERVALEDFQKTGLNGLHGEICSIAWALDDNDIECLTRTHGFDEQDLLNAFWQQLRMGLTDLGGNKGNWHKLEWIGHNVLGFDLRFLKQRCIINGVNPRYDIPADGRHGQGWVFDTMLEWGGIYRTQMVSQDNLCDALGIVAPDWATHVALTDGSKVWDMWRNGDYELLATYNKLDVWKVHKIYKKMTYA